ncbi:MAG: 4-hydroxy-tetrahydrodipicolinate reductase [Fusobacteriaceae bacterium]|jgi:4-hydroxy-tetrahydrodipicolinate reductase|nr:4-hydroxy-tetrahydrodipicolinate reductase [Fusobacteriaceae bacterium]
MNIIIHGTGTMSVLLRKTIDENEELKVSGFADELTNEIGDVIIDFSHYSRIESLLNFATSKKIPLLIATTGYPKDIYDKIAEASKNIPILLSSNTSLGINIMVKILKEITPILKDNYDIEIIEKHHNKKLDSPSGTAKTLANVIASKIDGETKNIFGRYGNKKREKNEIGIHAIRGGTVAGEHIVLFYGDDEILEIKHTAASKKIFVLGAIKSAKILLDKPIGLYTMEDII